MKDAEIYFPKFGFGFGRNSFLEMVKGFEGVLEYIQHDYDRLNFIPSADYLVVEGISQGRMSSKAWAGGRTPGGRFCNIFKFRDGRITSLHIYLDPDYTGEDEARFRWRRTVDGKSDDHPSGGFSFNRERISWPWNLEPIFVILKRLIFESSVRAGSPSSWRRRMGPRPVHNIPLVRFR